MITGGQVALGVEFLEIQILEAGASAFEARKLQGVGGRHSEKLPKFVFRRLHFDPLRMSSPPLHKFQPELTAYGHGCFARRAQRS
jgi:hypothetical protein